MSEMKLDVVGMNHRLLPGKRRTLATYIETSPLKCKLQREPDNIYDKNAIKVLVTDSRLNKSRLHIGYVRRGTAEVVAQGMDSGRLKVKSCHLTDVDVTHGSGSLTVVFLKTPASKPFSS